jgi:hypothetical protein
MQYILLDTRKNIYFSAAAAVCGVCLSDISYIFSHLTSYINDRRFRGHFAQ